MIHPFLSLVSLALLVGTDSDSFKLAKHGKVLEGRIVFEGKDEIVPPDAAAFAVAKRANFDLNRVFNANINDFNGDSRRGEMTASAYSLVHYLVFGKDGALRAGYGKFLREGAKGKISAGALSEALDLPRKEIESGWRAYIDANAR